MKLITYTGRLLRIETRSDDGGTRLFYRRFGICGKWLTFNNVLFKSEAEAREHALKYIASVECVSREEIKVEEITA